MQSVDSYSSLADMLERSVALHGDRVACSALGGNLTYNALWTHAGHWAAWLQSLALPEKSRVAIMLPNVMASLVSLLGTLRAGHVVVNVNPLYTPRELCAQLTDSEPDVIIVFEAFASVLAKVPQDIRPKHVVVVSPGDLLGGFKRLLVNWVVRYVKRRVPAWSLPGSLHLREVLRVGAHCSLMPVLIKPDDLAFLQYTGGTTGEPRAAMLSHHNVMANVLQVEDIAKPVLHDLLPQPLTMLTALPLYHVFAMTVCALYPLHAGMRTVLVINPRDLPALTAIWRQEQPHIFPAVNTLFQALLRHKPFQALDFSRLRIALGGGMAVHASVAKQWQALTGRTIVEGYGMSETSPVICANPTDTEVFSGTVGLPLPGTVVQILDDHQEPVPDGQAGEIAVKGPQVMLGYWRAPAATAAAMTAEQFLLTGDIGVREPQGFIRIIDRKKDMVNVSGFNVYPAEVDAVFAAHPDVLDCACVGVPDSGTGEAVKLFVVAAQPNIDLASLSRWGNERLTGYKRPREIVLVESLPKNPVGKTLRRLLKDVNA
jgi:long-chain acyl-CoA synthetase